MLRKWTYKKRNKNNVEKVDPQQVEKPDVPQIDHQQVEKKQCAKSSLHKSRRTHRRAVVAVVVPTLTLKQCGNENITHDSASLAWLPPVPLCCEQLLGTALHSCATRRCVPQEGVGPARSASGPSQAAFFSMCSGVGCAVSDGSELQQQLQRQLQRWQWQRWQ